MSQALLLFVIYLIGLAVCAAWGPARGAILTCSAAFPVGLSLSVIALLSLLVCGIPFSSWTLALPLLLLTGLALWFVLRREGVVGVRRFAWPTVAFALFVTAISLGNFSRMSTDSHHFVICGRTIARSGLLDTEMYEQLQAWGVFQVLAHALVRFTRLSQAAR